MELYWYIHMEIQMDLSLDLMCRTLALNIQSYTDCINLYEEGGYYDTDLGTECCLQVHLTGRSN